MGRYSGIAGPNKWLKWVDTWVFSSCSLKKLMCFYFFLVLQIENMLWAMAMPTLGILLLSVFTYEALEHHSQVIAILTKERVSLSAKLSWPTSKSPRVVQIGHQVTITQDSIRGKCISHLVCTLDVLGSIHGHQKRSSVASFLRGLLWLVRTIEIILIFTLIYWRPLAVSTE